MDRGDRGQSPEGELPSPALSTGLRPRQSQDYCAISHLEKKLLDLCCSANMLRTHGRVAGDTPGMFTFPIPRGKSSGVLGSHVCTLWLATTLAVQEGQPKSDHCPLHLSLRLPRTSTPAPLPTPQHLQSSGTALERVSQHCAHLATHLSNASAEENPAPWLQTCISTSAAATHGLQMPTRLLIIPLVRCRTLASKTYTKLGFLLISCALPSLLASYKALLPAQKA